ncbi:hypothetical protein WJX73_009969 [Symbiochloris irregularis]|uniref:Dicer-like protein 1 n=1 Tax=Symbiochloris irregularis TaxID=706552 RepID=A0AAW1NV96_9CHLO
MWPALLLDNAEGHSALLSLVAAAPEDVGFQLPPLDVPDADAYQIVGYLGQGRVCDVSAKLWASEWHVPRPVIVTTPVITPLSQGPLEPHIMQGLVAALQGLHNLHIVHGDVEPKHFGEDAEGRANLIDLDCARKMSAVEDSLTSYHAFRGTLGYADDEIHDLIIAAQKAGSSSQQRLAAALLYAEPDSAQGDCWALPTSLSMASTLPSLVPRAYQTELYEEALGGNIIAYMDTGTGKTLISVLLIKATIAKLPPNAKASKVIFLVPTVGLVSQQGMVLQQQTPFNIGKFHGSMGTDLWKHADWQAQMAKFDCMVMTYQVFLNALTSAFVQMTSIALLVVDECHHCKKLSPLNQIFKNFYHTVQPITDRPHVFGMTASPLDQKTRKNDIKAQAFIKELEGNMGCKVVTVADRNTVTDSVPLPTESLLPYPSALLHVETVEAVGKLDRVAEILRVEAVRVQRQTDLSRLKRAGLQAEANGRLIIDEEKSNTESLTMARAVTSVSHILCSLGPYCAALALAAVMGPRAKTFAGQLQAFAEDMQLEFYPSGGRQMSPEDGDQDASELAAQELSDAEEGLVICTQLKMAVEVVMELMNPYVENPEPLEPSPSSDWLGWEKEGMQGTKWCGIIFAERKMTVYVLQKLLAAIPSLSFLRTGALMGAGGRLSAMAPTAKANEGILMQLKEGDLDLVVATAMAEEGLDIIQCQMVLRFDLPKRAVEFIQSRGRARAQDSRLFLMVESGNAQELTLIDECRRAEHIMRTEAGTRVDDMVEDLEDQEEPVPAHPPGLEPLGEHYMVPATGAFLTLADAKSRLFHFCAKLPSDKYSQHAMRPRFSTERIDNPPGFQSLVLLPSNCPVRQVQGNHHTTKSAAQASACLQALGQLHEEGALTDHLVPDCQRGISGQSEEDLVEEDSTGTPRSDPLPAAASLQMRTPAALLHPGMQQASSHTMQVYVLVWCDGSQPRLEGDFGLGIDLPSLALLSPAVLPPLPPVPPPQDTTGKHSKAPLVNLEHVGEMQVTCDEMLVLQRSHRNLVRYSAHPRAAFEAPDNASPISCPRSPSSEEEPEDSIFSGLWAVPVKPASGEQQSVDPSSSVCPELDWAVIDQAATGPVPIDWRESDHEAINERLAGAVILSCYGNRLLYRFRRMRPDLCPDDTLEGFNAMDGRILSYTAYYEERYGITGLDAKQPLMEVTHYDRKLSAPSEPVQLLPEICVVMPATHALLLYSRVLVPRVLWWVCSCLTALELQQQLRTLQSCSLQQVIEALMPNRCQEFMSLERLEILGDAVLKFHASWHLYSANARAHEGQLTAWRHAIVSNESLVRMACSMDDQGGLQPFINHPCSSLDFSHGRPEGMIGNLRIKVVADCLEALIGAAHEGGGPDAALALLQEMSIIPEEASLLCPAPSPKNGKCSFMLRQLQEKIGYKFNSLPLADEAVTHCSSTDAGVPCYQRLEYLGDAVLDFMLTRHFVAIHKGCGPGVLHDLRSDDEAHENGDAANGVAANGDEATEATEALTAQRKAEAQRRVIDAAVNDISFGREGMEPPPKALGDMVEAIIGAVFIDSAGDLNATWQVVSHLFGLLPTPQTVTLHPVRQLGEFAAKRGQQLMFQIEALKHRPGTPCPTGRPENGPSLTMCTCVAVNAMIGGVAVGRCECARSRRAGKLAAADAALQSWNTPDSLPTRRFI